MMPRARRRHAPQLGIRVRQRRSGVPPPQLPPVLRRPAGQPRRDLDAAGRPGVARPRAHQRPAHPRPDHGARLPARAPARAVRRPDRGRPAQAADADRHPGGPDDARVHPVRARRHGHRPGVADPRAGHDPRHHERRRHAHPPGVHRRDGRARGRRQRRRPQLGGLQRGADRRARDRRPHDRLLRRRRQRRVPDQRPVVPGRDHRVRGDARERPQPPRRLRPPGVAGGGPHEPRGRAALRPAPRHGADDDADRRHGVHVRVQLRGHHPGPREGRPGHRCDRLRVPHGGDRHRVARRGAGDRVLGPLATGDRAARRRHPRPRRCSRPRSSRCSRSPS